MGEPLKRVKPGEDFKPHAKTHNAFVEAAEYVRTLRGGAPPATMQWSQTVAHVKNVSGAAVSRGNVLEITDVFPSPTDNANGFDIGPVLHGDTPTVNGRGKFVILLSPADLDDIVPAVISGAVVTTVNVTEESDRHTFATSIAGDVTQLALTAHGEARVFWRESGLGQKKAVVVLGQAHDDGIVICKATSQIPARSGTTLGTATVQPQKINTSDEHEDDGPTETLYSWTQNPSQIPAGGGYILVIAHRDAKGNLIWIGEDCA